MKEKPEGYVLGDGYVGSAFRQTQKGWLGTHRQKTEDSIIFDWLLKDTWQNLGPAKDCLITCPLREGSNYIFNDFLHFLNHNFEHIVVISSISIYLEYGTPYNPVNEESVLDYNSHQLQREQALMKSGAVVLNCSGIYGPGKNPIDWLRKQLVSPQKTHVNLIHVDDLAKIIDRVFKKNFEKERFIVSDGISHNWEELIKFAKEKGFLPESFQREGKKGRQDRFISNKKLLKHLPSDFEFSNLYEYLETEESH
ncbi:MAG: hypothetical protein H7A25_20985 [Leptospiraceae bacterium]|nr:hypothetical protein [Leptospiraceae bacterium]MCP5502385.1 hypothetical protein [Leptospiraceae bacterium]